MVGRGKKKALSQIKDQVGRRIASWKGKILSNAGREILMKAVAQATPHLHYELFPPPRLVMLGVELFGLKLLLEAKREERKLASVS